ncbi:MAG: divalent-cation tolerance protein CutA [Rhodocyclales bacterium]|nr:divalent-cation tolerance protein CutA [Rhodocyclales bacterium]
METAQTLLILTNLPDESSARTLARGLLEARLAACINILAPCTSVYRWQGAVEEAREVPVLIKTTAIRYAALENAIRAAHPYELPEIIAVPIGRGLPAYLDWVAAETLPATPESPAPC